MNKSDGMTHPVLDNTFYCTPDPAGLHLSVGRSRRSWRNLWLGKPCIKIIRESTISNNLIIDCDLEICAGVRLHCGGDLTMKVKSLQLSGMIAMANNGS